MIMSTLRAFGDPSGHSAIAPFVGVPYGFAMQLVLDGELSTLGVLALYSMEICELIRKVLEAGLVEEVL